LAARAAAPMCAIAACRSAEVIRGLSQTGVPARPGSGPGARRNAPRARRRALDARWEGFRRLARRVRLAPVERLDRAGAIEVDEGVELLGRPRLEVVAQSLGLRPVDDADRPLQARRGERGGERAIAAHRQGEAGDARLVEQR